MRVRNQFFPCVHIHRKAKFFEILRQRIHRCLDATCVQGTRARCRVYMYMCEIEDRRSHCVLQTRHLSPTYIGRAPRAPGINFVSTPFNKPTFYGAGTHSRALIGLTGEKYFIFSSSFLFYFLVDPTPPRIAFEF